MSEPLKSNGDHKLQLQLYDLYGVPVPNTQFWITIKILKEGDKITLQLPLINFQTGQYANNPQEPPSPIPPFVPGGYLYTSDGFLPKDVRPSDPVHRSWLAATDNGVNQTFSFTQNTLPNPISGYILQVTNFGGIIVQGAGTFGNIIPAGNQTLLPTTISYLAEETCQLKKNIKLSKGFTETSKFTGPTPFSASNGLKDWHVNDAYDGVSAWAWVDNSMVTDKTNGVLNLVVRIGKINSKGKLKLADPINLTPNLTPPFSVGDTAITINRVDKDNIIVSYILINYIDSSTPWDFTLVPSRAISFDGGNTWPINGPINTQPIGMTLGDDVGVKSDKYGNIWYIATNLFNEVSAEAVEINQPYIAVSVDKGKTYTVIYIAPLPPPNGIYDWPLYCFGGDGQGNYGLHFTMETPANPPGNGLDVFPTVGFIPITGPGLNNIGTPITTQLTQFTNNNLDPDITASADGKVWLYGGPAGESYGILPAPMSGLTTTRIVYKSPGGIDQNYVGSWDVAVTNYLNSAFFFQTDASQPILGYYRSAKTIIYDDKREALYVVVGEHTPSFSQNYSLYLLISRDNGQTWSKPFYISNTTFANRGFYSIALDTKKGDLYFGWYDGRNDPTYKSVQYYGALVKAKKLDKWVREIPSSNPTYIVPASSSTKIIKELTTEQLEMRKKLLEKRRNRWYCKNTNKNLRQIQQKTT